MQAMVVVYVSLRGALSAGTLSELSKGGALAQKSGHVKRVLEHCELCGMRILVEPVCLVKDPLSRGEAQKCCSC